MTNHHTLQLYTRITSATYLVVYAVGALALLTWLLMLVQPFGFSLHASGSTLVVATAPHASVAEGTRVAIAHPEGIAHHARTGIITAHTRQGGSLQYELGNSTSIPSHAVVGSVAATLPLLGLFVAALATLPGVLAFLGAPLLLFAATQFFVQRSSRRAAHAQQHHARTAPLWATLAGGMRTWSEARRARRQARAIARANKQAAEETPAEPFLAFDDAAPMQAEQPDVAASPAYEHEVYGAVVRLARRTQRRIHPQLSY